MDIRQQRISFLQKTVMPMVIITFVFTVTFFFLLVEFVDSKNTVEGPKAEYGFPPVGSMWQYVVKEGSKTYTIMCEVLEDGEYREKPVHRILIRRGDASPLMEILDKKTRSWVTTLLNGKPVGSQEARPHNSMFSWPLWVGKKWRAAFRYENFHHKCSWKVEAFEKVTVPAGTFDTFKVKVSQRPYWSMIYWYDPETKLIVKQKDFADRRGKRTTELKAYRIAD